jgi:hypothetical protein
MLTIKIKKLILVASALFTPLSFASIIIPSDYNVNASISYDSANSYQLEATQSDTIAIGTNTTSIINSAIGGDNPVNGSLNSPLSFNTSFSNDGNDVDFESIFYNFEVTIENNSLTTGAEFFFNLNYLQNTFVEIESIVDDAYVDTMITIESETFDGIFSSTLFSDPFTGADSASGNFEFSRSVSAGESLTFTGTLAINGYSFGNAYFEQETNGMLSLTNIIETSTNVPTPSTAFLLLPALLFLRRKTQ